MAVLKRRWVRVVILIVGLVLLYAFTRLTNLTKLPIFTDEAIYIRWSQIGSRDANWRFISLVDGKQPLFTWIMMVLLRFVQDPLLAGRLVSVIAGLFTSIGIWFTAQELFRNYKISFVASLLYILIPFGLMYDRMALYDSWVAAFSIWNLYLSLLLVRRVRLDIALIFGLTLGLGMLNKTSAFLSLYMLPGTLLLFDFTQKNVPKRLLTWLGYALVAAVISQALYSVLRLSPLFHMVAEKDAVFVYPFREWLGHPFTFLYGNLKGLFDWAVNYLTWPIFTAAILTGLSLWKKPREKLLLLGWWLAPLVALAMFGKVLYPRFILFMTLPLLILAARAVVWVWDFFEKSLWRWVFVAILFFGSIYADYFIITNPLYAPIPYADVGQYIDYWPSGWGIPQVNTFLLAESAKGKVSVYTDGTFGLLPYAIEIYLVDKPNIDIHGLWPVPQDIPQEIIDDAKDHATYMIFNQTQDVPLWPMTLVASYQKGNRSDTFLRLYRIVPELQQQLKKK